jgi:hypothetical protein
VLCVGGRVAPSILSREGADGNIRLRAAIPQNCHSRESGNPWSDISAHDTILVRTKTRRPGATSLCLRAFVRTILTTVPPMGSRFRGNDKLRGSRRGAEAAEKHSPQRHAELVAASIVPNRPKGKEAKWTLEPLACLHKQVQGDGNIRLRTPIPQNCHSRESGNPWSDISAHDTILVRTKTRRQGATSLCLRAFVRTILTTVPPMGSRFRGNDKLRGSRRGAEAAEVHSPQLGLASIVPNGPKGGDEKWTLEPKACLHKQVQGDGFGGGDGVVHAKPRRKGERQFPSLLLCGFAALRDKFA